MSLNAPLDNTAPGTCNTNPTGSLYFGFTVSATVPKECKINTTSDINLGNKDATATNIIGNTVIGVTCTATTPYNIGLAPATSDPLGTVNNGSGLLNGTGSNTDTVPYQLFSDSNRTKKWGNTATSTSVGNGVTGQGNGSPKTYPVYVTVPSADFKPDTYTDTVTINVNY